MPHIVFNPAVPDEAYFPGPSFWRSDDVVGHPPVDTSGIIQPPVHAVAAAAVTAHLGEEGLGFGRRIYPCLVAQNAYLRRCRTGPGGELAFVTHPWETGMDNSPAWDSPLAAVPADLAVFDTHTRRDLDHAGDHERPTDEDYARYIRLAAAYRDHGYDDRWVAEEGEFVVLDPGFNALWGWSELALADLAGQIGRDPEPHRAEAERITTALIRELYAAGADGSGLFHGPRSAGRSSAAGANRGRVCFRWCSPACRRTSSTGWSPRLTGPVFRAGAGEVLGVPSFDLTAPGFDPQRYWRGPSWLNTTWLVGRGLQAHGRDELAASVLADVIRLAQASGLREYFNPYTAAGHGTDRFSWSAALVLDVLAT